MIPQFVGELTDFVIEDLKKIYPSLAPYTTVSLINAGSSILNAFDQVLQKRAEESLKQRGISLILNARVTKVEKNLLQYKLKSINGSIPETSDLRFGLCVWAAGTAPRPLTVKLAENIGPIQTESVAKTGKISVDPWLRVNGLSSDTFGSVFAIGDASLVTENESSKQEGTLPQTAQVRYFN